MEKIFGKENFEKDDDPWEMNEEDEFYIPGSISLTFLNSKMKQFIARIDTPNKYFKINPDHHHDEEYVLTFQI